MANYDLDYQPPKQGGFSRFLLGDIPQDAYNRRYLQRLALAQAMQNLEGSRFNLDTAREMVNRERRRGAAAETEHDLYGTTGTPGFIRGSREGLRSAFDEAMEGFTATAPTEPVKRTGRYAEFLQFLQDNPGMAGDDARQRFAELYGHFGRTPPENALEGFSEQELSSVEKMLGVTAPVPGTEGGAASSGASSTQDVLGALLSGGIGGRSVPLNDAAALVRARRRATQRQPAPAGPGAVASAVKGSESTAVAALKQKAREGDTKAQEYLRKKGLTW